MKIVSLRIRNFLRIRSVFIEPNGDVVTLSGPNESGKTSVLRGDRIGDRRRPLPTEGGGEPRRSGWQAGGGRARPGAELKIRATMQNGKTARVVVSNADGAKYASPQALLDRLFTELSFSPVVFRDMKSAEQFEVVRKLAGVEVEDLDRREREVYDERRAVGKQLEQIKARLDGEPEVEGTPDAEVDEEVIRRRLRDARRAADDVDQAEANEGPGRTGGRRPGEPLSRGQGPRRGRQRTSACRTRCCRRPGEDLVD